MMRDGEMKINQIDSLVPFSLNAWLPADNGFLVTMVSHL
jgi:hypothetical protein